MFKRLIRHLLPLILTPIILVGCSTPGSTDPAPRAIESYLEALQGKDENQMIALSCAQWEAQAKLEYDSFAAVEIELQGPDCIKVGEDGQTVLVSCSGRIIAAYGDEDLVLELEDRTYQVVEEGGEWRMCGYR